MKQLNNSLLHAAWHGDTSKVKTIISSGYVESSSQGQALINAATKGHADIVSFLLDLPIQDLKTKGEKALIAACQQGQLEAAKLLISHEQISPAADDNSPLINALVNTFSGQPKVTDKHFEIADLLLKEPGVDPAARRHFSIKYAAQTGNIKAIKYLLALHSIDPSFDNNYALKLALQYGQVYVIDLLLKEKSVLSKLDKNSIALLNSLLTSIQSRPHDYDYDLTLLKFNQIKNNQYEGQFDPFGCHLLENGFESAYDSLNLSRQHVGCQI